MEIRQTNCSPFDQIVYNSPLALHMATSTRRNIDDLYMVLSLYFWKKDNQVITHDFQSVGKMIGNLKRLQGEFHVVDNDYVWLDLEDSTPTRVIMIRQSMRIF